MDTLELVPLDETSNPSRSLPTARLVTLRTVPEVTLIDAVPIPAGFNASTAVSPVADRFTVLVPPSNTMLPLPDPVRISAMMPLLSVGELLVTVVPVRVMVELPLRETVAIVALAPLVVVKELPFVVVMMASPEAGLHL